MKIVVQNGVNHCLSRKDAESVISLLPLDWGKRISQVLLAGGDALSTSIHRKERVVALICPRAPDSARSKLLAVSLLVRALAQAANSELPEGLEQRCQDLLGSQAA